MLVIISNKGNETEHEDIRKVDVTETNCVMVSKQGFVKNVRLHPYDLVTVERGVK